MAHAGFRTVLTQAMILVAIGAVIGVGDAFVFRPIQIGRPAPPPIDNSTPAGSPDKTAKPPQNSAQPAGPNTSAPVPTSPVQPSPTPTAPVQSTPDPASLPGGTCVPTPKDKLPPGQITMDEAKKIFDSGQAVFVDTRKLDMYEAGHVQGAYHIELHDFENGDPKILNFIDRSSVIVAYCVGGNCDESEAVARQLSGAGYQKVYVMHDGFPCWKALGFPVETGKGMTP